MPTTTKTREQELAAARALVNKHIPAGYEEKAGKMTVWQVPKAIMPETYNGQPMMYLALASQKNYIALHMVGLYFDSKLRTWFEAAYKKSGKKLDMGKGCLRFTSVDNLAIEVVGAAIAKLPAAEYAASVKKLYAGKKLKKVA